MYFFFFFEMSEIVRSLDGSISAKKFKNCPACKLALPEFDYVIVEGKELICTKCSIVYHVECGAITDCCTKWRCKQCAESCNKNTHWICMLQCNSMYCACD